MTARNKNIPVLRFKGSFYDLKQFKLVDLVTFKSGGTPTKDNPSYWNGDIPWISAASMHGKYYSKSDRTITELGLNNGSKLAPKYSLLLLVRGSMLYNKIPIGITAIDVAFNQDLKNLLVEENVSTEFLYQWFSAKENLLLDKVVGTGIGAGKLDTQELQNLPVSLPSLPEQQKIASFLSAIDEKIRQLTRRKELLEQYKKGVMQQLFSGKLRFKPALSGVEGDENGKAYPKWEEKKLGQIADIFGGGTPDTSISEYWDGEIQWFTPTEISERFVSKSKRTISRLGLEKSSAKLLPRGTILFTSRATIAELSFAIEECTTNQGFQSLVVNSANDLNFIFYCIKCNRKAFIRKSQGSTFLEISKTEIVKIKIHTPTLLEQIKIGNFLSSLDTKIESVSAQIARTQEFKKGLLQKMFV